METIILRCALLDVHKESIEACVRRMEPDNRLHQETRHWGTMTRDLLAWPTGWRRRASLTWGWNRLLETGL